MKKRFEVADILFLFFIIIYLTKLLQLSPHCLWSDEGWLGTITQNFNQGEGFHINQKYPVELRYIYFFMTSITTTLIPNPELGLTFPSILFSIVLLFSTYLILRKKISKELALLITVLLSWNPLVLFLSTRALGDIPYVGVVILQTYLLLDYFESKNVKQLYRFGILTGLNIFIKNQSMFALPAFALSILLFDKRKTFTKKHNYVLFGIIFSFLLLYLLSNFFTFGNVLGSQTLISAITPGKSTLDTGDLSFYVFQLSNLLTPILKTLFFLTIPFAFLQNKRITTTILLIFTSTFLFHSYLPVKVNRYGLILIPLAYIIIGLGLQLIIRLISKEYKIKSILLKTLIIVLLLQISFPNYLAGVDNVVSKSTGFCGFDGAGEVLKQLPNKEGNIITASSYRQLGYYANRDITALTQNKEIFLNQIENGTISFFVFDKWERVQPQWLVDEVSSGKYSLIYPQTPTQTDTVFIFSNPNMLAQK